MWSVLHIAGKLWVIVALTSLVLLCQHNVSASGSITILVPFLFTLTAFYKTECRDLHRILWLQWHLQVWDPGSTVLKQDNGKNNPVLQDFHPWVLLYSSSSMSHSCASKISLAGIEAWPAVYVSAGWECAALGTGSPRFEDKFHYFHFSLFQKSEITGVCKILT